MKDDELSRTREALEAAEKEAARYRWLRDELLFSKPAQQIDQMIDKAIAKEALRVLTKSRPSAAWQSPCKGRVLPNPPSLIDARCPYRASKDGLCDRHRAEAKAKAKRQVAAVFNVDVALLMRALEA